MPPAKSNTRGQETYSKIPQHLAIDAVALERQLSRAVPELNAVGMTIKKFSTGQSNPTYALQFRSGETFVLRKKPPGKLIASAHKINREFKIMSSLKNMGLAVPQPIYYCEDASVIGAEFYIMTFVKGSIYDNSCLQVAQPFRRQVLMNMIGFLAQLHSVDIDAANLADYGRRGGFYERQIKTLSRVLQMQVAKSNGIPMLERGEEIIAWFQQHIPADRVSVIHGDFKPDNVVMDPNTHDVLAVLDWELSTIGHPYSDLANFLLPYHMPEGMVDGALFDAMGPGCPSEEELLRQYCHLTNTPYPISDWSFYLAFAFFRLAVILHGVASRISTNQASSDLMSARGANILANACVEFAFQQVETDY